MPFMNITPLRPEHVEPLARALYLQWHDFAPWSSMDKIRAYYAECLNGENLPLAFAAVGKDGDQGRTSNAGATNCSCDIEASLSCRLCNEWSKSGGD